MKKPVKVILIVLGSVVVLWLILKFGAEWYLSDQLTKKINESNQTFQVEVEDVQVSLINQKVILNKVIFHPVDSGTSSVEGTINEVELGSFDITGFLFNGIIKTEEIDINSPRIEYFKRKKSDTTQQKKSSGGLFTQDIFDKIKVKTFSLNDASIKLSGNLRGNLQVGDFTLDNIVVDSTTMTGKLPFNYDSAAIIIDSVAYQPDSLYRISSSQINYSNNSLTISDFNLDALPEKSEFVQIFQQRKPIYHVFSERIILDSLFWHLPANEKMEFTMATLELDSTHIELYVDKRLPVKLNKPKPMPAQALLNLPFLLTIKEFIVDNSVFLYQIRPEDLDELADIRFTDLFLHGYHITNDSTLLDEDQDANFDINAMFMNNSNIEASFSFNLVQNDYPFTAEGNLDPMNFSQINAIIRPLLSVEVNGDLKNLTYTFDGNENNASGTVDLSYEELQIKFAEAPDESAPILKALSSIVAENNLERNNNKVAHVNFEKEKMRGFFYYWWSGIQEGIKHTVLP